MWPYERERNRTFKKRSWATIYHKVKIKSEITYDLWPVHLTLSTVLCLQYTHSQELPAHKLCCVISQHLNVTRTPILSNCPTVVGGLKISSGWICLLATASLHLVSSLLPVLSIRPSYKDLFLVICLSSSRSVCACRHAGDACVLWKPALSRKSPLSISRSVELDLLIYTDFLPYWIVQSAPLTPNGDIFIA